MPTTTPKPTRSTRHYARLSSHGQGVVASAAIVAAQNTNHGLEIELVSALSDYGSDLDTDGETALEEVLTHLEAQQPLVLESLDNNVSETGFVHVPTVQAGMVVEREDGSDPTASGIEASRYSEEVKVSSPGGRSTIFLQTPDQPQLETLAEQKEAEEIKEDTRSPLERFRMAPKKPLSVTDIVSPAWCELQYWYTLTKHGKKRRTPAMKQGSKVHRQLEEQVHQIVPVTVQTREDGWGLKIWNVIQGLRTLRMTGLTRELEVWGLVDGQVVNGIIDELSYRAPWSEDEDAPSIHYFTMQKQDPSNQMTLDEFFKNARPIHSNQSTSAVSARWRKVFLTDVKTRSTHVLPKGASLLPTFYQLMMYHRLLTALATNQVSADTVFKRYNLDSHSPFSDAFIAEIGGLDFSSSQESNIIEPHSQGMNDDTLTELLAHNNLTSLWSLMILEFEKSIPTGSVNEVLTAEFRSQNDGALLGRKHFQMDDRTMNQYLSSGMKWWKGEREARGVEIEDAFKCRICEFADNCTWRKAKAEESMERHRARTRKRSEPTQS